MTILASSQGWLTLREASKQFGVSPATLRQWADSGKVESFRTPGGHRRFKLAQSTQAAEPAKQKRQMEMLIHSALGKARLEIASGRLDHEKWHRAFNGPAKEAHRKLGQQLMSTLITLLREDQINANLDTQAFEIGRAYARLSVAQGISLIDSLRAYLFFRDYVFEGLFELASNTPTIGSLNVYHRLNQFINTMLIAIVESFSGETNHK